MRQGRLGRPVLFERVDANGTRRHINIGVVDFRQEKAARWRRGKVRGKDELEQKELALIGRPLRTGNLTLVTRERSNCR